MQARQQSLLTVLCGRAILGGCEHCASPSLRPQQGHAMVLLLPLPSNRGRTWGFVHSPVQVYVVASNDKPLKNTQKPHTLEWGDLGGALSSPWKLIRVTLPASRGIEVHPWRQRNDATFTVVCFMLLVLSRVILQSQPFEPPPKQKKKKRAGGDLDSRNTVFYCSSRFATEFFSFELGRGWYQMIFALRFCQCCNPRPPCGLP